MFESIRGILQEKAVQKAVVEAGGIGYRLLIPLSAYPLLPLIGTEAFFFLSHVVREDTETLFAFLKREERDLFELLLTISGIGPKTALAIIGHLDRDLFLQAIHGADIRLLSKIPGIGKKSAERLVLELKDKISFESAPSNVAMNAVQALIHLGYPLAQAQKAVNKALEAGGEDLGKIISKALQHI